MKKEQMNIRNEREKLQEKMKRQKLREKGITLIALVVTIIILLILAGVTLSLSISQNGLFSRAQNAVDRYKKAQTDEEEMVKNMAAEIEKMGSGNNSGNDEEESKIQVKLEVEEAQVTGTSIPVKATVTGEDGEEVQGEITYKWYKKKEGSDTETEETENESNGSYTFNGLEQDKDYTIRVVAKTSDGEEKEESVTVKALIIKYLQNTSDSGTLNYFRYRDGMTWSEWTES